MSLSFAPWCGHCRTLVSVINYCARKVSPTRVFVVSLYPFGAPASVLATNRVQTQTASAPHDRLAASERPSSTAPV